MKVQRLVAQVVIRVTLFFRNFSMVILITQLIIRLLLITTIKKINNI